MSSCVILITRKLVLLKFFTHNADLVTGSSYQMTHINLLTVLLCSIRRCLSSNLLFCVFSSTRPFCCRTPLRLTIALILICMVLIEGVFLRIRKYLLCWFAVTRDNLVLRIRRLKLCLKLFIHLTMQL